MEAVGRVIQKRVAIGSKSEHDAVVLRTGDHEYALRTKRGDPWWDPEMARLIGKKIKAIGTLYMGLLIVNDWKEID